MEPVHTYDMMRASRFNGKGKKGALRSGLSETARSNMLADIMRGSLIMAVLIVLSRGVDWS